MNLVGEEEFHCTVMNRLITPSCVHLAGMVSSWSKLGRKVACVTVRFKKLKERDYYFRKLHLLVDLEEKKVLHCCLTEGVFLT